MIELEIICIKICLTFYFYSKTNDVYQFFNFFL